MPIVGLETAQAQDPEVACSRETSYIAPNAPESAVVLSPRMRKLIAQVGGCQTSQVEAVIRRVIYEVLKNQKGAY